MTSPDTVADCLSILDRHTPPAQRTLGITAAERASLARQGLIKSVAAVKRIAPSPVPHKRKPTRLQLLAADYCSSARNRGDLRRMAKAGGYTSGSLQMAVFRHREKQRNLQLRQAA